METGYLDATLAPQNRQVSTLTLFRFDRWPQKYWAFLQMGLFPVWPLRAKGLIFRKMFGSGAANGFGLKPNWGVYGLLLVWHSEQDALLFFEKHTRFRRYLRRANAVQTVFLRNVGAHGLWDNQQPFVSQGAFDPQMPVAVITRASIRLKFALRFWKYVAPVSAALDGKKGLIFAIGIGELPLIRQATFSLWAQGTDMLAYAYKGSEHRQVVQKTRELGWYREEMFSRFEPYRTLGSGFFDLNK
ncbi:MAG: DUF3291 domain-containing protein [Bacteroidetes bacterium]|nr:DUF3291 domain-containing protein [Bacteroidota bacterium]